MNLKSFEAGLRQSYIDSSKPSEIEYQSVLLYNDQGRGQKFLSQLLEELDGCDEFWISVAFATTSGVASIINTLSELKDKGVSGKILVSQYLNFTQPEALRRLKQFENIELKIAVGDSFHSKGYLFKHGDLQHIIIGSSNLTQSALSTNKEWNLKVCSSSNGQIYKQVEYEFAKEFERAQYVTSSFISRYEKHWEYVRKKATNLNFDLNQQVISVEPNKMQKEALSNLARLRSEGASKALLISATGTGKTYLSAFDVQLLKPKKFLFVVHRRTIAEKAMETFKSLLGNEVTMGVFSGRQRELDCDYMFSTIQTISKTENLNLFERNHFEYIVIDETHRAGAESYKRILEYFEPGFTLGMTATPERTDGIDVFKLFNYNIAYEIRLNRALAENMLSPFHYYGVTDVTVDNEPVDDHSDFNKLTSDERIRHIVEKSKFYGTDSGDIRGLVFCSKNEISKDLSVKFNEFGFRTVCLTGTSTETDRMSAIDQLESGNLDYIFTVDIFNEGIDIPSVNQIIMLRPTQSAIVFVQQLGRGLRKSKRKEYLTVIDFIGNYSNNYLVPVALYGDTSYNKDTLRKLMAGGSSLIPGVSTVNFDKVSKERIFNSINSANVQRLVELKKDYLSLKAKIGRIPMMVDFLDFEMRDPWLFASYRKSYLQFVNLMEDRYRNSSSIHIDQLLSLFTLEINNGKRVEESLLLQMLMERGSVQLDEYVGLIDSNYGYAIRETTIQSVIANLNFHFINNPSDIVKFDGRMFQIGDDLSTALVNSTFKKFLLDSINYSIRTFELNLTQAEYVGGFLRYRKYSRKDVCRILNWEKDLSSTIYGYRTRDLVTPCFVTYHKSSELEGDINYNDHFISRQLFAWESRSNRKTTSREIQNVINSTRILLFIKKEDGEGTDFYYTGDVTIIPDSIKQAITDKGAPIVHFTFRLDKSLDKALYDYLTTS